MFPIPIPAPIAAKPAPIAAPNLDGSAAVTVSNKISKMYLNPDCIQNSWGFVLNR